jgi:hypothetical protein
MLCIMFYLFQQVYMLYTTICYVWSCDNVVVQSLTMMFEIHVRILWDAIMFH